MIIDPLVQHEPEKIAALNPTVEQAMELARYFNYNLNKFTEDERQLYMANFLAVYRLVPRADVVKYIEEVTQTRLPPPPHPFKMQHELDRAT